MSCCTPDPQPATAADAAPMCAAEYLDRDHELGCELPDGHDGPHRDGDTEFVDKPPRFPSLPLDLTEGLTVWGDWGGAQMRIEHELCSTAGCQFAPTSDDGEPVPHTHPELAAGALYLAHRDDAPRSPEDGAPYRLTDREARALRDLLNIATARGFL